MAVHINEVLTYLEKHFGRTEAGRIDSVMEKIYDAYNIHNCADGGDLCREREVLAFSQGVLVGMLFMTEVNMLP